MGGRPHGAAACIVEKCVRRMVAWAGLATLVLETEFPDFDVMGAFAVLSVREDLSPIEEES